VGGAFFRADQGSFAALGWQVEGGRLQLQTARGGSQSRALGAGQAAPAPPLTARV